MEKLIKELEEAKERCSFSLSFIAPYRTENGNYDWGEKSAYEYETLDTRYYEYQDLKSKIKEIQKEIKDKQERIDNFAMSVISSAMNSADKIGKDLSCSNIVKMSYNYAESMEAERQRRINALYK